jgi:hypothetical protein
MKVWFDTEFIEDGETIDLISIGLVREDGAKLYLESAECDLSRASGWVKENVIPHLVGGLCRKSRADMQRAIVDFCGGSPEFWAYYADYDWVALCQLFGTMMDLPTGWPMFCLDLKQLCFLQGDPRLPSQPSTAHHALSDAVWVRDSYVWLTQQAPQNTRTE